MNQSVEKDAGCVECGGVIDRTIPNPIPEGYELMWSESMTGRALYCLACYSATPPVDDEDDARVFPSADGRNPAPCPKCGEVCKYDGWGLVHANGIGIGSCPIPPANPEPGDPQ